MALFIRKALRFLAAEDGPTAVEYAVMLALIVMISLIAIQQLGTATSDTFQESADSLDAARGVGP